MTASAFLWPSGVDPAQHAASTIIGLSGKKALRIIALEITQISVQTPISVIPVSYTHLDVYKRQTLESDTFLLSTFILIFYFL